MDIKGRIGAICKRYKHVWVFCYAFLYMPWFLYLEKHVTSGYYVIHSPLDDKIPFIEFFIIPYLLWFAFIAGVFLYFFFTDTEGFYKLAKISIVGMTIFLIISTLIPNGVALRPIIFERDNIFVNMVKVLYRTDTPTNVFPSLHVFNTLAACIALNRNERFKRHKIVCMSTHMLAALIILATMFLKQHSVIDVMAAFLMAYILYQIVYATQEQKEKKTVTHTFFISKF